KKSHKSPRKRSQDVARVHRESVEPLAGGPANNGGPHGRSVDSPPADARDLRRLRPPPRYKEPKARRGPGPRGEASPQFLPRLLARQGKRRPVLLPAWTASYPALARPLDRPSARPRLIARSGQLSSEALAPISNTIDVPFRYICNLEIEPAQGNSLLGG